MTERPQALPTLVSGRQRQARTKDFVAYIKEQMKKEYGIELGAKASAPK